MLLLPSYAKFALPWPFVFWLIMLVAVVAMPLIRWWRKLRAQSWPTVQGIIVDTAIYERPVQSGIWAAELVYSCTVEGQVHAGRYKRRFDNLEEAQEFVRDLKDRSIAIHYRPAKPSHSALDEQDLRTLLEQRPPAPPVLLQVAALPVSLWVKIFAYPFMAVAGFGIGVAGLVCGSSCGHICGFWAWSIADQTRQSEEFLQQATCAITRNIALLNICVWNLCHAEFRGFLFPDGRSAEARCAAVERFFGTLDALLSCVHCHAVSGNASEERYCRSAAGWELAVRKLMQARRSFPYAGPAGPANRAGHPGP